MDFMVSEGFVALIPKKKSNQSRTQESYLVMNSPSLNVTEAGLIDYPSRKFLVSWAGPSPVCKCPMPGSLMASSVCRHSLLSPISPFFSISMPHSFSLPPSVLTISLSFC